MLEKNNMKLNDSQLKMLLLGSNLLSYDKLNIAEEEAKKKGTSLLDILPIMGFVSSEQLGRIVASELKYNYVNLKNEKIDKEVLTLIPELVAYNRGIIAFNRVKEGIKLGMLNPDDIESVNLIEKKPAKTFCPIISRGRIWNRLWQNIMAV